MHLNTHTHTITESSSRFGAKPQADWERQELQAGMGAAKNSSILKALVVPRRSNLSLPTPAPIPEATCPHIRLLGLSSQFGMTVIYLTVSHALPRQSAVVGEDARASLGIRARGSPWQPHPSCLPAAGMPVPNEGRNSLRG